MFCPSCHHDPCTCMPVSKPIHTWIVAYCTTPGCGSRIRYRDDQNIGDPRCKWCQSGTAYYTQDRAP